MPDKPHVVHVIGRPRAGGVQKQVLALATSQALSAYKHSVICVREDRGDLFDAYKRSGVEVFSCLIRPWPSFPYRPYRVTRWILRNLFQLRFVHILKNINANLVHIQQIYELSSQVKAVSQLKIPWIWTLRGLYRSTSVDMTLLKRAVYLVNESNCARITAVSKAALDDLKIEYPICEEKCQVIHNGICLDQFNPELPKQPGWRAKWGIPDDVCLFGAAGSLIEIKRHDLLVDAAAILRDSGANFHVAIAGDGHLRQHLEEHIRRLGIESRFHLLGYQSDMQRFMREMDVFVLPSDSEGFPNVLLEACAMRLPCVATAVGGVPELLRNGSGILIEPGSVDALAQAMQQMLSPETRKMYARRARTVVEQFSIEEIARQYALLYEELLACR